MNCRSGAPGAQSPASQSLGPFCNKKISWGTGDWVSGAPTQSVMII